MKAVKPVFNVCVHSGHPGLGGGQNCACVWQPVAVKPANDGTLDWLGEALLTGVATGLRLSHLSLWRNGLFLQSGPIVYCNSPYANKKGQYRLKFRIDVKI